MDKRVLQSLWGYSVSNQGKRQESVRAVTGTTYPYEGDWHSLFDMAGIPSGSFNGRLLAWINDYLGTTYTELNGAMAAFAQDQGADSWNGLGTFDAVGFTPADIPDLALWLDAADTATITQTGGAVSAWADKSGNGYNATQAIGARQPVSTPASLNGKNTLFFDGTKSIELASALWSLPTGNFHISVVVKQTNLSGILHRTLSGKVGGTTNFGIFDFTGLPTANFNGRCGGMLSGDVTYDTTFGHIESLQRNGTGLEIFYDGVSKATNATATNITLTELVLGWDINATSGQSLYGNIAEVVIVSRSITSDERNKLNAYLKAKWGTP